MRSTLTLFFLTIIFKCQGECPIECYCDHSTTCTGDTILKKFPSVATGDSNNGASITRLELREYSMNHVTKREFLDILTHLDFTLKVLSLTRNSIREFDNDTFSQSVNSVPLRGNGSFQLEVLDLSQNKLVYFVGGPRLKSVKTLDLSSNQLQQVYQLSGIESLESVNLRDNRITYLEPNLFQGLRNLQYVNLDSNEVQRVPSALFSNLPSLAHLILSSNPVQNLLPGFLWNSRVQFVDVSRVGLTQVPTCLIKTVRDFRCASNNLTVIRQSDFESYPNVALLVLDENSIEMIEDDAFGRLEFLARLWINGNKLSRPPQNLPVSLKSLQLEENQIGNLTLGDFKNLRNLEELNLHGNRIGAIPPSAFSDLVQLRYLDLRSNSIEFISAELFSTLRNLQGLDLSHNPIKVIVNGAFGSLGRLSLFHLSRITEPVIEFDTGVFQPLDALEILQLEDSPRLAQKLIQDDGLAYFPALIELNLQRCELDDLNIVSVSIEELSLQSVKLSENPWDCESFDVSAVQELIQKKIVSDLKESVCDKPEKVRGMGVIGAFEAQVKERENRSSTRPPESVTVATKEIGTEFDQTSNEPPGPPKRENEEKLTLQQTQTNVTKPADSNFSSGKTDGLPNPSNFSKELTMTNRKTNNVSTPPNPTKGMGRGSPPGSTEAIPTRSYYFEEAEEEEVQRNHHPIYSPDQIEPPNEKNLLRTKTKTNDDDNAIIDERPEKAGAFRGSGSIDGFPPRHPDNNPVQKETPSSSPKMSYLRSSYGIPSRKDEEVEDPPSGPSSSIIIKTIVISTVTCLASVFSLLVISYLLFRYTPINSARIFNFRRIGSSRGKAERTSERDGMAYTRFDQDHHQQNHHDHVELSGISNRLYFENENIYHIT